MAGTAGADAPAIQGWWTTASGSGAGVPVAAGGPDQPTGGLVVESDGSTSAPFAFAALSFDAAPPAGGTATLTLAVAPNSATTPAASLQICPLQSPSFQPADGGDMSQAPKYDCAKNVTAAVSSDGKSFSFALASLLNGSAVAVAVLPAGAAERVVLSQPDSGALQVASEAPSGSAGAAPGPDTSVIPDPGASSGATGSSAPAAASGNPTGDAAGVVSTATPGSGSAAAGLLGSPAAATPSIASAPAAPASPAPPAANVPADQPGSSAAAGASPPRAVAIGASSPARSGPGAPLVAVIAVAAVVLAGLLWGFAGSASAAGGAGDGSPTGGAGP